ncbi:MAG: hypothetical protein JO056_00305 [Alphaproteobacteria bacterium]|nr:hypothetical protein [Alphaproteobacteria bacterium]
MSAFLHRHAHLIAQRYHLGGVPAMFDSAQPEAPANSLLRHSPLPFGKGLCTLQVSRDC